MKEFLAFVDEIGRTTDGQYLYRFDFTTDTLSVWGEYFNVVPCAIIPGLQPDENCLTKRAKVTFPIKMVIAKQNFCFSMQDCIDGIIPLMFSEIDENTIELDEKPIFFRFGEEISEVEDKLKKIGLNLFDIEEVKNGDDSAIEDLINRIGTENNDDEDNPF